MDAPSGVPTGGVPPAGVLEEVDGTPIVPVAATPAAAALSWRRGAAAALSLAAGRPALWLYALIAFLARGGLLVLALPIVVLPTFLGIANVVGPASVSAAGPSPRLVALVAAGVAGVTALVLVGTAIAAAAETALHRATVAPDPDDAVEPAGPGGTRPPDGPPAAGSTRPPDGLPDGGGSFMVLAPAVGAGRATARVFALRVVLLVPVVAVGALAVPAWVAVAYRELTLPSDVAAPLLLRVLAGAPRASSAVLVAWLGAEIVGGFATRRAVLFDASAARALGSAVVDPFRAPVGTTATAVSAIGLSVLALAPGDVGDGGGVERGAQDPRRRDRRRRGARHRPGPGGGLARGARPGRDRRRCARDPRHGRAAAPRPGPRPWRSGRHGWRPCRIASRDGRPARRMSARGLDAADALLHCAACAAGGTPSEHDGARRTEVGDPTAWT